MAFTLSSRPPLVILAAAGTALVLVLYVLSSLFSRGPAIDGLTERRLMAMAMEEGNFGTMPPSDSDAAFWQRLARNMANMHRAVLDQTVQYHTVNLNVLGVEMTVIDTVDSNVVSIVLPELNEDEYKLRQQDFSHITWAPNKDKDGNSAAILDLGCNIGITAILMAKMFPKARIITIEPIPYTYALALTNVKLNGVADRVTVINAAIGSPDDLDKPLEFKYSLVNAGASTSDSSWQQSSRWDDTKGSRVFPVYKVTIRELMRVFGITTVPFVKLDCEGCEFDLLADMDANDKELSAIFKKAVVVGETHEPVMPHVPKSKVDLAISYFTAYKPTN